MIAEQVPTNPEGELPVVISPVDVPCIRGQRLPISRLLAHLLWAGDEHRKEHPGMPYDLPCEGLWRKALRDYCDDFPSVSQLVAGEALGFTLRALAQLALDCPETVLRRAIVRALRKVKIAPGREAQGNEG